MKKHILYNTTTEKVIGKPYKGTYTDHWPRLKLKEWEVELEVIETPMPPYDYDTQRVINEGYKVIENKYVRTWRTEPLTAYEIAIRDWMHPEYEFRIIAPAELAFTDDGPKLKAWFDLNDLPIEKLQTGMIRVYCNTILHPDMLHQYQDFILIENRPENE